MSRFTDLFPEVSQAIDDEFGEGLGLRPWTRGRYTAAGAADPSRPARDLVGTFTEARGSMSASGNDARFRGESMPTLTPRATFSLTLFATADDWPREGDRLARLDLPGTPWYQVSLSESDDTGRLIVHLVRQ